MNLTSILETHGLLCPMLIFKGPIVGLRWSRGESPVGGLFTPVESAPSLR